MAFAVWADCKPRIDAKPMKSAIELDYCTTRFTVPVWVKEPEVPVMVNTYAPEVVPEMPFRPR